ncbi:hypothetical protein [Sphingorhabdus sp. YGSMI21]|uniref:hypothetical protein n=1 Tax=Sphingorhabdus sp. YGSMI21 TaxID=2077182 RepID=UPI000F4F2F11|nr:hypothetical protein [Sphingorhabdus sp. YGSMI21]
MRVAIAILLIITITMGCASLSNDQQLTSRKGPILSSHAQRALCDKAYAAVQPEDFQSHKLTSDGTSSLETKYALHEALDRVVQLLSECVDRSNSSLRAFLDDAYRDGAPHPNPATLNRHVFHCADRSRRTYPINLDGLCSNGYRGRLEASGFRQNDRPISNNRKAKLVWEKNSKIFFDDIDLSLRELRFFPQEPILPERGHFPSLLVLQPYFSESRKIGVVVGFHSPTNSDEDQRIVTSLEIYRRIKK